MFEQPPLSLTALVESAEEEAIYQGLGTKIVVPPTTNHIWKIFQNRQHSTPKYREWLAFCADILRAERRHPVEGPCSITITIVRGKGFAESRDIDNCIKPVLDVLKPPRFDRQQKLVGDGASLIADDSVGYVRRVTVEAIPAYDKKSEAECWVRIDPAPVHTHDRPKAKKTK